MESRGKRIERVELEIDISNFLPEAVFSNIISWLPVKEAVRTSVLVKCWKDAWKYVTRLDLDPVSISIPNVGKSQNGKQLTPTGRSSENLVHCTRLYSSIIQSIQDEVTHCQIVHFPINVIRGELENWVKELVMRKKVKSLTLKCCRTSIAGGYHSIIPLEVCPDIFSPFESLELTSYRLSNTSTFQHCEKLRILKMSNAALSCNSITEIFSFCKNLEELSMRNCSGFSNLKISCQKLKFLELRFLYIDSINISAKALATLKLIKVSCRWSSVVIDAPEVTELQVYCSIEGASQEHRETYLSQEKLLERCTGFLSCHERSHLLYSSHMGYASAFRNLQVLSTSLDLNDIRHAILLSYIFRVCLQLERLDITVEVRDPCKVGKLYYPEHLFWEQKGISDCIACCLRAVSIQNFRGEVLEMGFVKYLITRAPRMRRVTVKCADSCTDEEVTAAWSCLSFPRSSMNVSLVVDPLSPAAGEPALAQRRRQMRHAVGEAFSID